MNPALDPEKTLIEHLAQIERLADAVSRRHGLDRDDAEDFKSWVKLRLVENDYSILRKFRGDSSLSTYLTVVIASLYRDYRVQRWGRWRPSAAARRHGEVAMRLETLIYRKRYRLQDAAEVLRTSGQTQLSDGELARLLEALPRREPLRPMEVGQEAVVSAPSVLKADDLISAEMGEEEQRAVEGAIVMAMEQLSAEDKVIVRLRFWEGLSIADVARALGIPQKPLYRHVERLVESLRRELERAGVTQESAREIFNAADDE